MYYITNLKLGEKGRFGNALFQYALLKSISIKTNKKIYLHNIDKKISDNQLCLLSELKLYTNEDLEKNKIDLKFYNYNEECMSCFEYFEDVFDLSNNINYNGYFQSYKYFDNIKHILEYDFSIINTSVIKISNEILTNIKTKFEDKELIAIHVRGGDKLKNNHIWWNITEEYLIKSLEHFNVNNVIFLIFNTDVSDDINNMIYKHINYDKRIIIRNNVLVDFNILKSCDHFILTNSSFAWWGAYLSNKNHNKKVIHPNSIFINKEDPRNNIQNYIPNNWIVI